ncbi:Acyl-CoA carboxylase epsilon subunit [Actinacidiphila rubida]|uniref:Acyl-CoA carboxylase epsilon subunit n=1 Tax=Actinacidiphila rubida TaxID=310780 RepID=A0A1H8KC06_9ACTN|nr:acyl-CoA carboxylase subunit epsilon [Actinacidiphila rubida]SEN90559.1 Acyl-CoA carboxylase epsilon subunit [Actinacidiphila rubida]
MTPPTPHAQAPAARPVDGGVPGPRQAGSPPAFRVVRGDATPVELAALAVVLLSVARPAGQEPDAAADPSRAAWHRPRHAPHRCPRSWRR